jgi:hypothetical protein
MDECTTIQLRLGLFYLALLLFELRNLPLELNVNYFFLLLLLLK